MTQSKRKLLGAFLLFGSIIVHAILFTAIYLTFLQGMPIGVLLPYFAVAGIAWIVPAGALIVWMSRPDPD